MSIVNNRPEIKRNFKVNPLPITCIHITCVRSWIRKQNRACPRSHSVLLYRDIESYAVISACVVLQEYAQQGIGSRIMEKCLDVVREYNYDLLYGCFSSFFSQRISAKFGFETILEVPYSGYLNQKEFSEEMKQIHKLNTYKVKRIWDKSDWKQFWIGTAHNQIRLILVWLRDRA